MPAPKSLFPEFRRLQAHMDDLWAQLTGGQMGGPRLCPPVIEPPVDIFETPEHVVVLAEVAGISGEEVEVSVEGDHLHFHGEKNDRHADPNHRHSQMEICYGLFGRTLTLPAEVDAGGIEVSYADGFLRIVLPKRPRQTSRQVRVQVPVRKV